MVTTKVQREVMKINERTENIDVEEIQIREIKVPKDVEVIKVIKVVQENEVIKNYDVEVVKEII